MNPADHYGFTIYCEICNHQIIHFSCEGKDDYDKYCWNNKEYLCKECDKACMDAKGQREYLKKI